MLNLLVFLSMVVASKVVANVNVSKRENKEFYLTLILPFIPCGTFLAVTIKVKEIIKT